MLRTFTNIGFYLILMAMIGLFCLHGYQGVQIVPALPAHTIMTNGNLVGQAYQDLGPLVGAEPHTSMMLDIVEACLEH